MTEFNQDRSSIDVDDHIVVSASGDTAFDASTSKNLICEVGHSGYDDIETLKLISVNVDHVSHAPGCPQERVVTFNDGITLPLSEIEKVIPCFTPGTAIAAPKGEVAVETLKIGDRVLTRDNGIQRITWAGTKRLDYAELQLIPSLRPILIKAGALGNRMPERDMLVSPSHRMLIVSEMAQFYFEQSEVLVAAKDLVMMKDVEVAKVPYVTYIHVMCDNHEIVLSDGAWSESFQPGDYTLKGFDQGQREELFQLFPELATNVGIAEYRAARRTLTRHEAKLLFKGTAPAS